MSKLSQEDEIKAEDAFKRAKNPSKSALSSSSPIQLVGQEVLVGGCIGSGAYATVYQASVASSSDVALKFESPCCPWEWYICQVLQGRVDEEAKKMFLLPTELLLGETSSVLIMPRGKSGTLQDLLNAYLKCGQKPDEALVMHCTLQLLCMLRQLRAARILHTDIKPDNFLINLEQDTSGDGKVWKLNLQMIDFGRSVDLELLPEGCQLKGDCDTDAFRCVEMRERKPWLWQADTYSVAGVVHCLLFGEYMDVERFQDPQGRLFLRIKSSFKRYWDTELWQSVFDTLLNSSEGGFDELISSLESRLQDKEAKVQQECSKLVRVVAAKHASQPLSRRRS